jgi:hypothetical protein
MVDIEKYKVCNRTNGFVRHLQTLIDKDTNYKNKVTLYTFMRALYL